VEWVLDRGSVVCGRRPVCYVCCVCGVVVLLRVLIPFSSLMKWITALLHFLRKKHFLSPKTLLFFRHQLFGCRILSGRAEVGTKATSPSRPTMSTWTRSQANRAVRGRRPCSTSTWRRSSSSIKVLEHANPVESSSQKQEHINQPLESGMDPNVLPPSDSALTQARANKSSLKTH
jgi:hypothetical protein